jgi:hypothetical protein
MGLVLDASGFPQRSEIFAGNVSEPQTLPGMLNKLNAKKGATVVMDAHWPIASLFLRKILSHPWPTIGKNDATVNYFCPGRPGDLAQQTSQANNSSSALCCVKYLWVLSSLPGEMSLPNILAIASTHCLLFNPQFVNIWFKSRCCAACTASCSGPTWRTSSCVKLLISTSWKSVKLTFASYSATVRASDGQYIRKAHLPR